MLRAEREIVEGFTRRKRRVAEQALLELARSTPVDTGRARSNWIVTHGFPAAYSRAQPFFPYKKQWNPIKFFERANLAAVVAAGKATLASTRLGVRVYMRNNVDYVWQLNAGSSVQAPAAFFQKAVQRARIFFKGLK